MGTSELEKAKIFTLVEVVEYPTNSVAVKNILNKTTGNINITAYNKGETLTRKASPFDAFLQVIDGSAEIILDRHHNILKSGQAIIIPAHSQCKISTIEPFKVISTIIKSGYDSVPVQIL